MSKLMPFIFMAVTVLILFMSWSNILNYNSDIEKEYNSHIVAAEALMEKEIYIDAVAEYKEALKIQPDNYEIALKIVDLYDKLEMKSSYISACQEAIKVDPAQLQPYMWLVDYYMENQNYQNAYNYLIRAQQNVGDSENIRNLIVEILGKYTSVSLPYNDFDGWIYANGSSVGYSRVEKGGLYGLVDSDNKNFTKCEYEYIGLYMNNLIPIKKDDEYYYVNSNGYRKVVPDEKAEYLGAFNDGYGVAKINGVYGYIDMKGKMYNFEYDYAGSFFNGLAAVQKDGKWAVINRSLQNVTDFIFDDILIDKYGFCSVYGVFFAKTGGKYYLYNSSGECISDDFDDAKLFASDEPAAVKVNDKWGFVSKSGKLVIEPKYENADSFCIGVAPFEKDGKWGVINDNSIVIIEPEFDDMKAFSRNGYSLVEEDGITKFICITTYK